MDSLPQAAAFKRLFVSTIRRDTQGEDNHDIRIHARLSEGLCRAIPFVISRSRKIIRTKTKMEERASDSVESA